MILYINTKDQREISVALKEKGDVVDYLIAKNKYGSQVLLPLIVRLLTRTKNPKNPDVSIQIHTGCVHSIWVKGIEVETGPGSFTGLRVGVSVANALGFSLGLPVNGKKMETKLVY